MIAYKKGYGISYLHTALMADDGKQRTFANRQAFAALYGTAIMDRIMIFADNVYGRGLCPYQVATKETIPEHQQPKQRPIAWQGTKQTKELDGGPWEPRAPGWQPPALGLISPEVSPKFARSQYFGGGSPGLPLRRSPTAISTYRQSSTLAVLRMGYTWEA